MNNDPNNNNNNNQNETPYEGSSELLESMIDDGASPWEIMDAFDSEYGEGEALEDALMDACGF